MEGTSWRPAGIMKVAATWLWLVALTSLTWTTSSQLVLGNTEDGVAALGRPTVTAPPILEFKPWGADKKRFSKFVTALRKELASEYIRHGIPVLRNPKQVPIDQRFLLVKLFRVSDVPVTLAIDITTANVVGYRTERSKSYFFEDTWDLASPILFIDTKKDKLPFKSTYSQLEEAAAARREDIKLSCYSLDSAIVTLDDKESYQEIAGALIVIMQVVCGAARFRYIEHQMYFNIGRSEIHFKPDAAMIELENNWNRLSTGIQQSYQKAFTNWFPIKRSNGELFHVDSVSDILKANLALLKFNCISGRDRFSSSSSSSHPSTNNYPLRQVISTTSEEEDACPKVEPTTRIVGRDGLCVTVQDGDSTDGNKIMLHDCEFNHFWTLKRDSTIRWKDKCLIATSINEDDNNQEAPQQTTNNVNIMVIHNCLTAPHELTLWDVTTNGSIVSRVDDAMCLTAQSPGQGTTLTSEKTTLSSSQAWLPTYHYKPFRASIVMFYFGLCMTLKGEDRVTLVKCDWDDRSSRGWDIYPDGTIRPVPAPRRCLTSESNSLVEIKDCIGSPSQRWMFMNDGTILNPGSELVLEAVTLAPGYDVKLKKPSGNDGQKWIPLL
ncbi:hypothetical protein Tsubulata_028472 [Turnera subulata]|uniref:Ribosome-inactivating protein n=1 Tax=Turnera subulata TaxID=218843 RepID=A0A9Q0FN13_9ROSI|nr:hypothetical protein Tsubulata_028472 [Turnera subulata]